MKLYIGNKNYSSWSLRPWLLMKHFEIPFSECLVGVAGRSANDLHRSYSKNGLVPCLHLDDDFQIWDTLAIAEFLSETYPDKHLYPEARYARARARSISAEMHSGLGNLRGAMPMNIKMRLRGLKSGVVVQQDVWDDINRVVEIWTEARKDFGALTTDPYLFGPFSVADAMFAPVIWRFFSYNVPLTGVAQQYMETMLAHPAMKEWESAALQETVSLPYDEAILSQFGGLRAGLPVQKINI